MGYSISFSSLPCIRGHRSSSCNHNNRTLIRVRSRGRPQANERRVAIQPRSDNDVITEVPSPSIISNQSKNSKVQKDAKKSTKASCNCGLKMNSKAPSEDSDPNKIENKIPQEGPIKSCCSEKETGACCLQSDVITIDGKYDQHFVEIGKSGTRFLSEADLIKSKQKKVFNFISENPSNGSKSNGNDSIPLTSSSASSLFQSSAVGNTQQTKFTFKVSRYCCCGTDECDCATCEGCKTNYYQHSNDKSDDSGELINSIQPQSLETPQSEIPTKPDIQQILNDFYQPDLGSSKLNPIKSENSENVNLPKYPYQINTSDNSPLSSANQNLSFAATNGSLSSNSNSNFNSLQSNFYVSEPNNGGCCSKPSNKPINDNVLVPTTKSCCAKTSERCSPEKTPQPKPQKSSCCSSKSNQPKTHLPAESSYESMPITDYENRIELQHQFSSNNLFADNISTPEPSKPISREINSSINYHSKDLENNMDNINTVSPAAINSGNAPNLILPMNTNLNELISSILSPTNYDKDEISDLIKYLEHRKEKIDDYSLSPTMGMTVAASCVLPGQCQCGDDCKCPGCNTHGNKQSFSGSSFINAVQGVEHTLLAQQHSNITSSIDNFDAPSSVIDNIYSSPENLEKYNNNGNHNLNIERSYHKENPQNTVTLQNFESNPGYGQSIKATDGNILLNYGNCNGTNESNFEHSSDLFSSFSLTESLPFGPSDINELEKALSFSEVSTDSTIRPQQPSNNFSSGNTFSEIIPVGNIGTGTSKITGNDTLNKDLLNDTKENQNLGNCKGCCYSHSGNVTPVTPRNELPDPLLPQELSTLSSSPMVQVENTSQDISIANPRIGLPTKSTGPNLLQDSTMDPINVSESFVDFNLLENMSPIKINYT